MGNDGGSIPTRRELVKEAARNPTASQIKESLQEQQEHLWNNDPLSQRPLAKPIVSDCLGRLFNKDSIIEYLLPAEEGSEAKRAEQEEFLKGTVKSLKDVVEVKFEVDEGTTSKERGVSRRIERWVCPITREELGPAAKAVYLVPCGHAFAGVAVKEVSGERCLQCEEPYASNDIIPILPAVETDIARLSLRMKTLKEKGLSHSLKKAKTDKKRKQRDAEPATADRSGTISIPVESTTISHMQPPSKPSTPQSASGTSTPKALNGIKNAATASLTARVLEEQEERNKRRKMDASNTINSLFAANKPSAQEGGKKPRDIDFMNRGFTVGDKR